MTNATVREAVADSAEDAPQDPRTSSESPMTQRQIMRAMWGLVLALLVAVLSSTIVSNALPVIIADLEGTQRQYTWVVTAMLLTGYTSLPVPAVYLLSAAGAFAGGLALYELVARVPVLRWCVLGISKRRKDRVS